MSDLLQHPDDAAKELGLMVIRPRNQELFVDLDSPDASTSFEAMWEFFDGWEPGAKITANRPSRIEGHRHVVVDLGRPVKNATERVLLQLVLGSDRKREFLSLKRIEHGFDDADVTVFFEKLA